MVTELAKQNSGESYIQYRGFQSDVTVQGVGVAFRVGRRETPEGYPDMTEHVALPVATREEILSGEAAPNAVPEELARELVEGDVSNPLIRYGVACEHVEDGEVCGEVFDSPDALNGHLGTHYGGADGSEGGEDDLAESPTERAEVGVEDRTVTVDETTETTAVAHAETTDETGTETEPMNDTTDGENGDEQNGSAEVSGMTSAEADATEYASENTEPSGDDREDEEDSR